MSTTPTRISGRRVQRPSPAPIEGQPLQYSSFTTKQFTTEDGISAVNQFLQQIVIAINGLNGSAGRVSLAKGLDVKGSTISGVGTPQNESDAISAGHASGQYSAPVLAPQLDVGGKNALKGLTGIALQMAQAFTGTIPLAKLTGGGSNGSITVKNGLITAVVDPT